MIIYGILFTCTAIAVMLVGGVQAWLFTSRPAAENVTFLLMLITVGYSPMLNDLRTQRSIRPASLIIAVLTFLVELTFSRILALSVALSMCLIYAYAALDFRDYLKRVRYFYLGIFGFALVFVIYGAVKHVIERTDSYNVGEMNRFIQSNDDMNLLSPVNVYRISVEGMSGFSGAVSSDLSGQHSPDWGIGILDAFLRVIPSFARGPLLEFSQYLRINSFKSDSIVASGIECFYGHAGFFGLILYGIVLGSYGNWVPRLLSNCLARRGSIIVPYVLIIMSNFLVRGTTGVMVTFSIGMFSAAFIGQTVYSLYSRR